MSEILKRRLIDAASLGDLEAVERALQAGADVHAENDVALRLASERGHKDVVNLLLKSGADVHAGDDYALRWSARNGRLDVVALLLSSGADLHNDTDYAFRMAAYNGHTQVVDLLLKAGADHAQNNLALQWSAYNGHADVVEVLVQAGIDLTILIRTRLKQTQLTNFMKQHAATAFRGHEAVMMLDEKPRMAVLRHLHPELKPKQIRDELAIMSALGLNAAQMGKMWQDRHGVVPQKQEMAVLP